jgi:hypothetical protein
MRATVQVAPTNGGIKTNITLQVARHRTLIGLI